MRVIHPARDEWQLLLNGFYMHPPGFKYALRCTGKSAGNVASIEWFKHPTRMGALLDTDVFKVALGNYLYTSEFLYMSGAAVHSVTVRESVASRVDTALEFYVKSLPNATVCIKAENRSVVLF